MRKEYRSLFIFRDISRSKGQHHRVYVIPAEDENDAWRIFGHKWAVWNFGLSRKSSLKEVKDYFKDTIEVMAPEEVMEFEGGAISPTPQQRESIRKLDQMGVPEKEILDMIDLSILKDE